MAVGERIRPGTFGAAKGLAHADARAPSRRRQTGLLLRHYLEMCAPMCIGFARYATPGDR